MKLFDLEVEVSRPIYVSVPVKNLLGFLRERFGRIRLVFLLIDIVCRYSEVCSDHNFRRRNQGVNIVEGFQNIRYGHLFIEVV